MQNIPVHKKILSYLFPVLIRRAVSDINPLIEIYFYRGQWQLATADALYSDGDRYRPLVAAYNVMKQVLPKLKDVLVLGAGLGSAVSIMRRMGFHPSFTLVDYDKTVLQWALEFSERVVGQNIIPVCADASEFVNSNEETYDMLIVDVFLGRVVPDFVTSIDFLEACKKKLKPGGYIILNYIINEPLGWGDMKNNFEKIFHEPKVIKLDINRILIAQMV